MGHETLPIEIRRKVYEFTLHLYETFEALPERGVLVSDIEMVANKILSGVARYGVLEDKSKLIKDIIGDLKAMKALLGIVRDTSMLERQVILKLMDECRETESIFENVLKGLAINKDPIGPERVIEKVASPALLTDAFKEAIARREAAGPFNQSAAILGSTIGGVADLDSDQESDDTNHEEAALPHAIENEKSQEMSLRQKAIMEVLKRRAKVTVGELGLLFTGKVGKKTLQRDLQELVERGVVKKRGDRRWTQYFIP